MQASEHGRKEASVMIRWRSCPVGVGVEIWDCSRVPSPHPRFSPFLPNFKPQVGVEDIVVYLNKVDQVDDEEMLGTADWLVLF